MNNYFSQMGMMDFIFSYIQSDIENFKLIAKELNCNIKFDINKKTVIISIYVF